MGIGSNRRRRCSWLSSDDSCRVHKVVILRLGGAPAVGDGCRRGVGLASSRRRRPAILVNLPREMAVARHDPLRVPAGCSNRYGEGVEGSGGHVRRAAADRDTLLISDGAQLGHGLSLASPGGCHAGRLASLRRVSIGRSDKRSLS